MRNVAETTETYITEDLELTMSETLRGELQELNTRVHELEKNIAVTNERMKSLQKTVETMCNGIVKVLWIFGGALGAAAATFVIKGGLVL